MALDFSKIFSNMDARKRVFVLFIAVLAIAGFIYFLTQYLSGNNEGTGSSHVANAPQSLQSVPGGQLTPEYHRALLQANVQGAQKAQKSGGSAVPTLLNMGQGSNNGMPSSGGGQCTVLCSDDAINNVKSTLDDWVRQGKLDPDVANQLQQMANQNVSVGEYSDALNQLVKEGKLTPEQARELLDRYKKQHAGALLKDSAKLMDELIQSGQLPLDVANELLDAQKKGVSTSDYAAMLARMVKEGKISPEVAQRLLAQYTKQHAREVVNQSIASIQQMTRAGQIIPDVSKALVELENRMVSLDEYSQALREFVGKNQLTPVIADKILTEFRSQKASMGPGSSVNQLLQQAEQNAFGEIRDLLHDGKITQDVADNLTHMINKNVSMDEFKSAVNQLVQQNKLPANIAKLKLADYQQVSGLRVMQARLNQLQGNNVPSSNYAEELKRAVANGLLTPEQASKLMREYQALNASAGEAEATAALHGMPGQAATADFAKLQEAVAGSGNSSSENPILSALSSGNSGGGLTLNTQFETAQAQAAAQAAQERQQRLDALTNAMAGQAQQLINTWQPALMIHKEGAAALQPGMMGAGGAAAGSGTNGSRGGSSGMMTTDILIKAGTIIFAVLDTAVNSDYPDTPIMATIVSGKFKGAKLLGKLATAKGPAGQLDRITLSFSLMNMDQWQTSKPVVAFAIDPDTARTALASNVNYHYMKRFGAVMAAAFIKGYATGITSSSETTTTGIFGTSSSHPALNPKEKIAVGLGQVGDTLGQTLQNYTQIPPTVVVNAGAGLGILFMSDLS